MIHPTALVDEEVILGANVTIGPWSQLSGTLSLGTIPLLAQTVLSMVQHFGNDNKIHPFTLIGTNHKTKNLKSR